MKTKTTTIKKPSKHVIIFDHARVDPSHCLTDGLFRPLKRESNDAINQALNVKYKYDKYTFWWRNYCPLNITDQSVFLAVHRLASEKERTRKIGPLESSPIMKEVRNALELELDAADLDILVMESTLYEICQTMGIKKAGSNYKQIRESLLRLSGVTFVIYRGDDTSTVFWKANLFGQMANVDKKIIIAINPMLCKALAGGQSTFIDMEEQRGLKGDVAKRLHVWLSSWLRGGSSNKVQLDKLIPHVWGNVTDSSATRSRRNTLRKALLEIDNLDGWECKEEENGFVIVARPKLAIR